MTPKGLTSLKKNSPSNMKWRTWVFMNVCRINIHLHWRWNFVGANKLCLEVVVKIWYVECHFATTPINERSRLQVDMNYGLMDVTYYQWLVGSLIFLTHTWPYITYLVNVVSRFMSNPRKYHLKATKHIWSRLGFFYLMRKVLNSQGG